MENRDLEIEMYQERIKVLEAELNQYRSRYGTLDNPTSANKDEKIEQVKEVAKKGVEISKDIFSVTKNIFGKAKDSFQEEWEKQKSTKNDNPSPEKNSDDNSEFNKK